VSAAELEEREGEEVLYRVRTENVIARGPTTCLDNGHIIYARTQQEIDETVARWKKLGPQPTGFDLECAASPTVPNGTGLHPHLGTIRLAQFAVLDGGNGRPEALVFDHWQFDAGKAMELLADPARETIIHFAQMETRWVGYNYGIRIENLIDTCEASKLIYKRHGFTGEPLEEDLLRIGLDEEKAQAALAQAATEGAEDVKLPAPRGVRHALGVVSKRDLGVDLSKEFQNSYWDAVKLNRGQKKYAGEDALVLLDLWARQQQFLTAEDRASMAKAASALNDKAVGVSVDEARARNVAVLVEHGLTEAEILVDGELDPKFARALAEEKLLAVASTPVVKGCESARAKRMISACRNKRELDKLVEALPFMRLHFSNRASVRNAASARARALKNNTKKAKYPAKVQVAGWRQPF
jgi:ribonuclease D